MASRIKASRGRAPSRSRKPEQVPYLSREALLTLAGISESQLRLWEFEDIVSHAAIIEIEGRHVSVYNHGTLRRIKTIRALGEDLGINLAGIGVILHLLDQLSLRRPNP